MKTADQILAEFEDSYEMHFHQVDREWIISAMKLYALEFIRHCTAQKGEEFPFEQEINEKLSEKSLQWDWQWGFDAGIRFHRTKMIESAFSQYKDDSVNVFPQP